MSILDIRYLYIQTFLFRYSEDSATMGDDEKAAEIEKKKAEVRARLEAQAAGKKAKKGFMTPERKKKLRVRTLFYTEITPYSLFSFFSERRLLKS